MNMPTEKALQNMQIVHWPEVAATLEISMAECQTFLHFFREQPGCYTTQPSFAAPHGTLMNWKHLKETVQELHADGGCMPVEVQYIWGQLESIVLPGTDFVWFWNWNKNGPR